MLDEVKPTSNEEIRYVYNLDKKGYRILFILFIDAKKRDTI